MVAIPQPTQVYYFGCLSEPGHWVFKADSRIARSKAIPGTVFTMEHLDQRYVPIDSADQGASALHGVEGYTILAWHDYTVDSRPGSNSALIAHGNHTMERMIALMQVAFPSVFNRQTKPLHLA